MRLLHFPSLILSLLCLIQLISAWPRNICEWTHHPDNGTYSYNILSFTTKRFQSKPPDDVAKDLKRVLKEQGFLPKRKSGFKFSHGFWARVPEHARWAISFHTSDAVDPQTVVPFIKDVIADIWMEYKNSQEFPSWLFSDEKLEASPPKDNSGDDDCTICVGTKSGVFGKLKCPTGEHHFHQKCIEPWERASNSCPICRAKIIGDVIVWSKTNEAKGNGKYPDPSPPG